MDDAPDNPHDEACRRTVKYAILCAAMGLAATADRPLMASTVQSTGGAR
jgi:hypothetical protein